MKILYLTGLTRHKKKSFVDQYFPKKGRFYIYLKNNTKKIAVLTISGWGGGGFEVLQLIRKGIWFWWRFQKFLPQFTGRETKTNKIHLKQN